MLRHRPEISISNHGILLWRFSSLQEEAFDIADQVVVFNRGLVEQSGTPQELQEAPQSPFVMQFVSDTNSLPTRHTVRVPPPCVSCDP